MASTEMNRQLAELLEKMSLQPPLNATAGYYIEPIDYKDISDVSVLQQSYDISNRLLENCANEIRAKREAQIIEKLAAMGYEFKSKEAFYEFAKERLTMVQSQRQPNYCELYLDRKALVASWWNTFKFTQNGNQFSVISGEPSGEPE